MNNVPMNSPVSAPVQATPQRWTWDVFCHVVDNYGDVGVCWRLSRDFAERGHQVRLWLDDPQALKWMAPQGHPRVQVLQWPDPGHFLDIKPAQVVIEAFGRTLPAPYIDRMAELAHPAVWINLEYLSAEDYVERSHGLPSPQRAPNGRWLDKWFFYPGLTPRTGGLIREPDLTTRRAAFDRDAWLQELGLKREPGERVVSLFCYEGAPVNDWVQMLRHQPTLLLAAPGAAQSLLSEQITGDLSPAPGPIRLGQLRCHPLPWLSQRDYDHLLWSCDLNFVRGEDSLVRALWAQVPFVWHIYPQHDGAHVHKLQAFLAQMLRAFPEPLAQRVRQIFFHWNGLTPEASSEASSATLTMACNAGLSATELQDWQTAQEPWLRELRAREDLTRQLTAFVQTRIGPLKLDVNP